MDEDTTAAVVASLVLLGMWLGMASPVVYVAHRRMRRVERERGAPALPANEMPLLLRAVAAIAWPVALVVGIVAWAKEEWARLARDVTLIFLAQITASVLSASVLAIVYGPAPPPSSLRELVPLFVVACANLGLGVLVGTAFIWVWAGKRADRIRRAPPAGPEPGAWRYAVYAASLFFWPVGIMMAVVFAAPENARVGATAFRCSLVQIAWIAMAVCIGLPLLARAFAFE